MGECGCGTAVAVALVLQDILYCHDFCHGQLRITSKRTKKKTSKSVYGT